MADVKKINKSITIYLHNGDTYDVADGVTGNHATAALRQFKDKQIISFTDSGTEILIPFHSVLKIEVTTTEVTTTITDDFCTTRVGA